MTLGRIIPQSEGVLTRHTAERHWRPHEGCGVADVGLHVLTRHTAERHWRLAEPGASPPVSMCPNQTHRRKALETGFAGGVVVTDDGVLTRHTAERHWRRPQRAGDNRLLCVVLTRHTAERHWRRFDVDHKNISNHTS